MQKTLILGVGAQKAGTTWLHAALKGRPGVAPPPFKEYHAWDIAPGVQPQGAMKPGAYALREAMRADKTVWFDHFADLLAPQDARWAMDITPAYAGLSAAQFAEIREGMAARGITVKVVFLVRDPLERMWSQARMNHTRRRTPKVDFSTDPSPEEVLLQVHDTRGAHVRARYPDTLARLETVFAPGEIFVGIFEEIFGTGGAGPLWDFLGMPGPPDTGAKVHEGTAHDRPSEATCAKVARHYADVYAAMAARFPQVRDLWGGFAYLEADSSADSRA